MQVGLNERCLHHNVPLMYEGPALDVFLYPLLQKSRLFSRLAPRSFLEMFSDRFGILVNYRDKRTLTFVVA